MAANNKFDSKIWVCSAKSIVETFYVVSTGGIMGKTFLFLALCHFSMIV